MTIDTLVASFTEEQQDSMIAHWQQEARSDHDLDWLRDLLNEPELHARAETHIENKGYVRRDVFSPGEVWDVLKYDHANTRVTSLIVTEGFTSKAQALAFLQEQPQ